MSDQSTPSNNSNQVSATPSDNEIIALRKERLLQLQQAGRDPYAQTKFERTYKNAHVIEHFESLEGQSTRVAGRIKSKRGQGKIAFADLYDDSAKIQLIAQIDRLGEEKMEAFVALDLGDILGVTGEIAKSRRGEISILVTDFELLATSIQPPPDKYHGLENVETRYRQRYADLIANNEVATLF
jgi:lysyl-tRNA synthetase class 2